MHCVHQGGDQGGTTSDLQDSRGLQGPALGRRDSRLKWIPGHLVGIPRMRGGIFRYAQGFDLAYPDIENPRAASISPSEGGGSRTTGVALAKQKDMSSAWFDGKIRPLHKSLSGRLFRSPFFPAGQNRSQADSQEDQAPRPNLDLFDIVPGVNRRMQLAKSNIAVDEAISRLRKRHDGLYSRLCATSIPLLEGLVASSSLSELRLVHMPSRRRDSVHQTCARESLRSHSLFADASLRTPIAEGRADFVPVFFRTFPVSSKTGRSQSMRPSFRPLHPTAMDSVHWEPRSIQPVPRWTTLESLLPRSTNECREPWAFFPSLEADHGGDSY